MASERPTVDALRVEIGMQNAELLIFASMNAISRATPFDYSLATYVIDDGITPEDLEDIVHPRGKPFAYLLTIELDEGGVHAAAVWARFTDSDHPQDQSKILKTQLNAIRSIYSWMEDPDKREAMTPYEKESCSAFLTAATSFNWHENPQKLFEFEKIVKRLSSSYIALLKNTSVPLRD